jgi:hypothetical protein
MILAETQKLKSRSKRVVKEDIGDILEEQTKRRSWQSYKVNLEKYNVMYKPLSRHIVLGQRHLWAITLGLLDSVTGVRRKRR